MYFGDPVSHLHDMNKLDKLTCNQETLPAFTRYTREYQQLQMGLGKHDSRRTEQHVQQYIKNLPAGLKNLIVTQMVTRADLYMSLSLGQHFDQFLTLGQTRLTASTAAQPSGVVKPAQEHTNPPALLQGRNARGMLSLLMQALAAPRHTGAPLALSPVDATPSSFRWLAYKNPHDYRRYSTDLRAQLMRAHLCYFCWEPGHSFPTALKYQGRGRVTS